MNTQRAHLRPFLTIAAAVLALVALVLVIAARSGDGPTTLAAGAGAGQADATTPEDAAPSTAEATEPPATGGDAAAAPAVTEIPGIGLDEQLDWQTYGGETALRERIVQVCMDDQGFAYTPTSLTQGPADPEASAQGHPGDPNRVIYDGLSADDQRRYSQALAGVDDGYDDQQTTGAAPGGCVGVATEILPGAANLDPELIDGLVAEVGSHRTSDARCPDGLTPEEIDEQYLFDDDPSNDGEADRLLAECVRTSSVDIEAVQAYVDERAEAFAAHLERLDADLIAAERYIAG
jgi:hypothetical protein